MDPLPSAPGTLSETRLGLHRLAAYVIAPTRYASTGRFGLRSTAGGFGTPEFEHRRVRVERDQLIDERDGDQRRTPITTLQAAADFLDSTVDPDTAAEHDSPALGHVDVDLAIDAAASAYLGRWFEVAFTALTRVRTDPASADATEPQLWPGHFDAAIEVGDEDHRASYGASPGDNAIDEPYLYVAAWWPDKLPVEFGTGFWNAPSFSGSLLKVSEFGGDSDPVEVATDFWLRSRDRLER